MVQGITEFLPVSSSAHLVVLPQLIGEPDQGLLIDVAAHAGTLLAVMVYCFGDLVRLAHGVGRLAVGDYRSPPAHLVGLLVLGTGPVVLVGAVLWYFGAVQLLRNMEVIAWCTVVFGVALYLADRFGRMTTRMDDLTWRHALSIGVAQALALMPGVSRAGIVITAGRAVGLHREDAVRFAFLLAIPAIAAATVFGMVDLARTGDAVVVTVALSVFALAFISALLAIWLLLRLVRHWSLTVFVVYRIVLGVALLLYHYQVL